MTGADFNIKKDYQRQLDERISLINTIVLLKKQLVQKQARIKELEKGIPFLVACKKSPGASQSIIKRIIQETDSESTNSTDDSHTESRKLNSSHSALHSAQPIDIDTSSSSTSSNHETSRKKKRRRKYGESISTNSSSDKDKRDILSADTTFNDSLDYITLPFFTKDYFDISWSMMSPQSRKTLERHIHDFLEGKLSRKDLDNCYKVWNKKGGVRITIPESLGTPCMQWLVDKMELGRFQLKAVAVKKSPEKIKVSTGLMRNGENGKKWKESLSPLDQDLDLDLGSKNEKSSPRKNEMVEARKNEMVEARKNEMVEASSRNLRSSPTRESIHFNDDEEKEDCSTFEQTHRTRLASRETMEFDVEKDYFAVLDANRELQMEILKLKQLLVQSQKRERELEEKLKGNAPIKSNHIVDTVGKEPALKNRIVIQDLDDEESEQEKEVEEVKSAAEKKSHRTSPVAPLPSLEEYGELVEWSKMIKVRYPGSWSTMSSRHKQRACDLVREFIETQLKDLSKKCVIFRNSKEVLCIPEGLADEFVVWFDAKLDEGALNVLGSPRKTAKKIPTLSSGVSKKNAPKEAESPSKKKSPLKSKNDDEAKISFEDFLAKKGRAAIITVAEVDVDQLVISEPALKAVNILATNYSQVSVDQVRFRELVEKLGEGNYTDAEICEAFEKEFHPKRKASVGDCDMNSTKKAKTDSGAPEGSTRYNYLIRSIVPDFNKSDEGIRVQIKKQVKTWLKIELGSEFETCVASSSIGGKKEHKTYMIPKQLESKFLSWIKNILQGAGLL